MLPAPLLSPPISLPLLCPAPLPYPMYTPMLCPPLPPLYTPSSLAVPPSPLPSLLPSLPLSILPVQIEEKLNFPFNPAFFFSICLSALRRITNVNLRKKFYGELEDTSLEVGEALEDRLAKFDLEVSFFVVNFDIPPRLPSLPPAFFPSSSIPLSSLTLPPSLHPLQ